MTINQQLCITQYLKKKFTNQNNISVTIKNYCVQYEYWLRTAITRHPEPNQTRYSRYWRYLHTVNQLSFAALFCDLPGMNWFAATNLCGQNPYCYFNYTTRNFS